MEALGQTENRYSGIPRIQHAMEEAGLPAPEFRDNRGEFSVCLRNSAEPEPSVSSNLDPVLLEENKELFAFCREARTRKEISEFLGIRSTQYAMRRYIEPLVQAGAILLSNPNHPRSPKQTYRTNPAYLPY